MKNLCRLFLLLALVLLPLAGTVSPVYAAPVVDQTAPTTGWMFGVGNTLQQGIRSGMAGQLAGVDLFCHNAGSFTVSAWLGTPWQYGPPAYQTTMTCPGVGWAHADLSAGGLVLAAEQDFTIGASGGSLLLEATCYPGAYSRGDMYSAGVAYDCDLAFQTYMDEPSASADIQVDAFGNQNGLDVVQVAYTLAGTGGAAFDLGFYASQDLLFDGSDYFLSSYSVTDPAALTDGSHTLDLTLGTDINITNDGLPLVAFVDHYVLAVADPAGAIAESDETNNAAPFRGVYQYDPGPVPGQAGVFVHGSEGDDLIVVSPEGGVNINGVGSMPHDQIYAFYVYAHGGADTLDLSLTPYGAFSGSWAGPGDDLVKISPWIAVLDGGDGNDTLNAAHFTSQIRVDLAAGEAGWATGNTDVTGYENVVGTPFDDTLNGDPNANTLDGQGGADIIRGFGGNDMLLGGGGYDRLWGGDGDDTVRAQADGAQVYGDAGNDSIRGSDVADALSGGTGDDTLWPGLGLDIIRGDAGVDTVDFFHPTALGGVQVYLNQTTAYDQEGNVESITGVENVLGTPFPDQLVGDWNANLLFGRAGADWISGMSGNDVLWGGLSDNNPEGGDYLDGGAGDDVMYGNDDTCVDDNSPDLLYGSVGADTGYGAVSDVFFPSTETVVPCP